MSLSDLMDTVDVEKLFSMAVQAYLDTEYVRCTGTGIVPASLDGDLTEVRATNIGDALELAFDKFGPSRVVQIAVGLVAIDADAKIQIGEYFDGRELNPDSRLLEVAPTRAERLRETGTAFLSAVPYRGKTRLDLSRWLIKTLLLSVLETELRRGLGSGQQLSAWGLYHQRDRKLIKARLDTVEA